MKSYSRFFLIVSMFAATAVLMADESQYLLTPPQLEASTLEQPVKIPQGQRHPIRTLVSSLAIVLGGFLLLTLFLRKRETIPAEFKQHGPTELMQSLGELNITPQVKLNLVRVGTRLLVLHVGENSVQTVAEITDPDEVAPLLGRDAEDAPQVSDLLRRVEDTSRLAEIA